MVTEDETTPAVLQEAEAAQPTILQERAQEQLWKELQPCKAQVLGQSAKVSPLVVAGLVARHKVVEPLT